LRSLGSVLCKLSSGPRDGFQFHGEHAGARIDKQVRRGDIVEHRWIFDFFHARGHSVAITHIELQSAAGFRDRFIRECADPIHDLSVAKTCSAVSRRHCEAIVR
jgi:hypothetical protein